jgi:aerobic-type carbon monoxide dehydrogenase small subunit (CoxS/CutS family)
MTKGDSRAPPTTTLRLTINGKVTEVPRAPDRKLLEVLRIELGLTGAKYGCGEGECAACTVLLDEVPVLACQTPIGQAEGRKVTTVEGLAVHGRLNPAQRAFAELGAFQCGYCTPGMVVGATALLRSNPHPSEEQIREALNGHLCRCGGYTRILRAVRRAAEASGDAP